MSPGVTAGRARGDLVIGGELSIASVFSYDVPLNWFGGYGDFMVDPTVSRTRFSLGPEIGIGPLGMDGGLVVSTSGHSAAVTVCSRAWAPGAALRARPHAQAAHVPTAVGMG
jgi:hypothetical protein